jgi:hypothetical protein
MSKAVRWESWDGNGVEHMVFGERSSGVTAEGAILSGGDTHFAATYQLSCHPNGHLARAHVAVIGGPLLTLTSDGEGRWWTDEGKRVHALAGAIDVDFSASPFTNTLPIRRLDLGEGEAADIVAAYVRFPDLATFPDRQRYSCLEAGRLYRYEALDGEFSAVIEVDERGLVVNYEGLFRRIL